MAPGRRLRKWGPAFALASAALFAPVAGAEAAVTASASCTPGTLVFPGSTSLNCTLNVQTGPAVERFTVSARLPQFTGGNSNVGEGPTIGWGGPPVLTGPGKPLGSAITQASVEEPIPVDRGKPRAVIRCSELGGTHGNFGASFASSYEVPANTATSFDLRFGASDPPWPGDSLAPTIVLEAGAVAPGVSSTLPANIVIPIPEPVRQGVSGVRISFGTRPSTGGPLSGASREFRVGKSFRITGRTDPVVSKQVLRIYVMRSTKRKRGRPVTLAKVRTNRNGSFALKDWRPRKPGFYEVGVTYRSQQADLASDFACSRWFELVK